MYPMESRNTAAAWLCASAAVQSQALYNTHRADTHNKLYKYLHSDTIVGIFAAYSIAVVLKEAIRMKTAME